MKQLCLALSLAFANACLGAAAAEGDAVPGSSALQFAGFGADTPGGKGGRIIKVTTLAADGEGSLKAALEATGPRIVVFEVGGVIDWRKQSVDIINGQLTLAGETAPSPGITLIRGSIEVMANDVIIRHVRLRLGDGGDLKTPNWEGDCMAAVGPKAKNILFDHCSTAWSVDENLSISGPREKNGTASFVTIRHCIIAEALDRSTHPKGPHSKGTLIHDFVHDVALVGNFYAHDFNRHPYCKPNSTTYQANNVIYDPGSAAMHFAYVPNEYVTIPHPMLPPELTSMGNVVRLGRSSKPQLTSLFIGVGKLHQRDNLLYDREGALLWNGTGGDRARLANDQVVLVDQPMLAPKNFSPLPANATEAYVLKNAGARPKDRDAIDRRILENYRNRAGKIIDSQDEVGGYPKVAATHHRLDVPKNPAEVEAWLARFLQDVEY
jgi:hypothetical protein